MSWSLSKVAVLIGKWRVIIHGISTNMIIFDYYVAFFLANEKKQQTVEFFKLMFAYLNTENRGHIIMHLTVNIKP